MYHILRQNTVQVTAFKKRLAAPEITLDEMSLELRRYILQKQADIKIKKGVGKYSLQSTIYTLLEEHKKWAAEKSC